jgi:hypothetical protein
MSARTPAARLGLTLSVALSLTLIPAAGLSGQAAPGGGGGAADPFCWRGRALPACAAFALFEMEGGLAVASTRVVLETTDFRDERPLFDHEMAWNVGAMRNLSRVWALGGTVSLGTGSPTVLSGLRVRGRRWLRGSWSVELEAGAADTGINRGIDARGRWDSWGPTVGARLNFGDHASVFTRWEAAFARAATSGDLRREAGVHQGLYVGAGVGSTAAVAGTAALGAAALAWIAYVGLAYHGEL